MSPARKKSKAAAAKKSEGGVAQKGVAKKAGKKDDDSKPQALHEVKENPEHQIEKVSTSLTVVVLESIFFSVHSLSCSYIILFLSPIGDH